MIKDNCYIFTEAYNCGLILKKCLETFFQHHDGVTVNVFGTQDDFKEMGFFDNVNYIDLSDDVELTNSFNSGHLGTAHIGTRVIKEFSEGYDYIIHIDSDVIFRKESLSLLFDKIEEGYDIVGPRRCYEKNMNGRTDLGGQPDVSQTYFYAFNKNKITNYDFNTLKQMVVGWHTPLNYAILDYFDPVCFDILNNGGSIYFLSPDIVGGLTENGDKNNKYVELNIDMDFGENLIHFAGIGSGMKFHNKGGGRTHGSYVNWCLGRFGLYHKLFYGTNLNIPIDEHKLNLLKKELNYE